MPRPTLPIAPALLVLLAGAAAPARADDFAHAFFIDPPNLVRNGSAVFPGGYGVHLTTDADQAGSMWNDNLRQVRNGFVTTFRFRIDPGPTTQIAGDGLALVLHSAESGTASLGSGGSGLGYDGIQNALAVEFDTFWFADEPQGPHVSVQAGGSGDGSSLGHALLTGPEMDILDGQRRTATVQYSPPVRDGEGQIVEPGRLEVYLGSALVLTTPLDLEDVDGHDLTNPDGRMWIGFTAGTGLADSVHVVTDWAFTGDTGGQCVPPGWHVTSWGSGGAGSTGEVTAHFTGSYPMTFAWYHNGVLIEDDRGGRVTGLGTDTLRVADLRLSDSGYYVCVAVNACGEVSSFEGAALVPCAVDFNLDGHVDPDDLGDFINGYFSLPPGDRADFNGDGSVDPDDLGDFINAFFGAPCE